MAKDLGKTDAFMIEIDAIYGKRKLVANASLCISAASARAGAAAKVCRCFECS